MQNDSVVMYDRFVQLRDDADFDDEVCAIF